MTFSTIASAACSLLRSAVRTNNYTLYKNRYAIISEFTSCSHRAHAYKGNTYLQLGALLFNLYIKEL